MLTLKRLRVERFRSLAKGAELLFADGINIVLGQNGTGKTTLLELISMVVRSDFSSLAKEEFAIEYELSASEKESVIVVIRNERMIVEPLAPSVELGAREVFQSSAEIFSGSERRQLMSYNPQHGLSVGDAPSKGPTGVPAPVEQGFLFFFLAHLPSVYGLLVGHLLRMGNAHRLDESLDLFRTITSTQGEFAGNILVAGRRWFPDPLAPPLVPDSIVRKLATAYVARKKPDYSFADNDLELLNTLKNMMGFNAAGLRVDLTPAQLAPAAMKISNLVFHFWWKDGTFISHERLSYGQKRLLIFFYYLECNVDFVIADELVNGLHHRWITASIEALGPRQAFLTSQNPLLLDYIPITSAEEVQRSFVLCRGEPRPGRPGWIWENMSEEDAVELFSAYQVGVEHVSEILQSRGLW